MKDLAYKNVFLPHKSVLQNAHVITRPKLRNLCIALWAKRQTKRIPYSELNRLRSQEITKLRLRKKIQGIGKEKSVSRLTYETDGRQEKARPNE